MPISDKEDVLSGETKMPERLYKYRAFSNRTLHSTPRL